MGLAQLQESEFQEAIKKQQEENARKEWNRANGSNVRNYEQVVYSALEVGKLKFVRIMGYPFHAHHKDPLYSPKEIFISWIIGDRGNRFRCIWPNKNDEPNWFLYNLYYRIMERSWDENDKPSYIHETLNPELFRRVSKNVVKPTDKPHKYETGWYPTKYVVMNVIDREMYDWHKENQHCVLLSKKATPYTKQDGSEVLIYEPGVPSTVFGMVTHNDMAGAYGDFLNYDVVIKRLKTNEQPYYAVYHPDDEKRFIADYNSVEDFKRDYPFYDPDWHRSSITEEESEWERYNIDQIFKVTSYQKLLKNLKGYLKKVDATFNSRYLEELQDLADDEKRKYQEQEDKKPIPKLEPKPESKPDPIEKESSKTEDQTPEQPLPTSTRTTRKVTSKVEKKNIIWNDIANTFKGVQFLSDGEKEAVFDVDEAGQKIIYDPQYDESLLDCPECQTPSPDFFVHCPLCGVEFE